MSGTIVVSDLDGTLSTAETWRGLLTWIREHHPSGAARRFVAVRFPLVVVAKAGLIGKEAFRARWFGELAGLLAGLPEDRLPELAEWVVGDWMWPARRTAVLELVGRAVAEARAADPDARFVVATGAYQQIADAFARRIGADLALGTPLELVNGRLTGRLMSPIQAGAQKAAAVRALAGAGTVATAFGDTEADIDFLRLASRAVAVAPDAPLRREARRAGWEIVEDA